MTLPSTGTIRLSQVNTELSFTTSTQINMGSSLVRQLASKLTGAIRMSDLLGKSLRGAQFFTTSTQYTVPSGTTSIRALIISGGGSTGVGVGAGGGGGGGIAFTASFAVLPGDVIDIRVGLGGWRGRGGSSSIENFRTGAQTAARPGFQGQSAVGTTVFGIGGASFNEVGNTLQGGSGIFQYGGGGAGAGGVGGAASTGTVGVGAPSRAWILNSTQTVFISGGGRGVGPVAQTTATVITSNVGEGASWTDQAGGAGAVIFY